MSPRQSIAHYRITSKIGEGGMGTVYRATDTKLHRDVAIKILPDRFASDAGRMARFTREAKILASLNHPNIAAIHDVEEHALVMELVEGETLKGPLPFETALNYARQIADALDYAHAKGIVHRDLKPANIKVTPDGVVKVLDFGLAKAAAEGLSSDTDTAATLTLDDTEAGAVLGTAGYMSPEQARGKPVDKRTDVWAFGVVLYELLTGKRLFARETASDTLAAVLTQEPDWDVVPSGARQLLKKCLEKDPKKRLRDIGDMNILLEQAPAPRAAVRSGPSIIIAAAAILAIAAALFWGTPWNQTETHSLMRFDAELGPDAFDASGDGSVITISPDGTRLAYIVHTNGGPNQIAVRLLGERTPTVLPGTENATGPFFSPDGQWLGFFAQRKLKKVSINGGPVTTLCDSSSARGAAWGPNGYIVANLNVGGGLYRVPQGGGDPQLITEPAKTGEATHRWPQFLPGGEDVLFTGHAITVNYDEASIEVLSVKSGKWKIVQRGGYYGRYVPTGHLLYVHQSTLYAVPFDLKRMEVRGAPVPLLDDVAGNRGNAAGQFDARNGMLVYISDRFYPKNWPAVWFDQTGQQASIALDAAKYSAPRISPDGSRLALAMAQGGGGSDIVVYDFARQTTVQLTFSHNNARPVWAPDGKHIAFVTESSRSVALRWVRADGAGETQTLLEDKNEIDPWSFAPSGRLAFAWLSKNAHYQLWTLPLDLHDPDNPKAGSPEPYLREDFNTMGPAFSPDGRWIAYMSYESPLIGVYVRPFPAPAVADSAKWQISNRGVYPMWSRNSSKLFYKNDDRIMSVDYTATKDSFIANKPEAWSNKPLPPTVGGCCDTWYMDVAPDAKHFVIFPRPETTRMGGGLDAQMLLNFFDELRRRVPVRN